MEISRRRLLQAFVAAPLATVPSIVFGALDRLPTAREVLANGENITVTCEWNPDQMMELAGYCAAFLYLDYKTTEDRVAMHTSFDNYIHFMLNNAGPTPLIFGLKAMFSSYNLPITPNKAKSFDRFHREAGEYIVRAVGDVGEASQQPLDLAIVEEVEQMLKTPGYVESMLPSLS